MFVISEINIFKMQTVEKVAKNLTELMIFILRKTKKKRKKIHLALFQYKFSTWWKRGSIV